LPSSHPAPGLAILPPIVYKPTQVTVENRTTGV